MAFTAARHAVLISFALALGPSTAEGAGLLRAWVSSQGADGPGCGPIVKPCRTLNGALANVAPGAEIDVKDAGAYGPGPVVIKHGVSIVNDGVGTAGVQSIDGANAFTIDAGPKDLIVIRGFSIDGGGSGGNGVAFNSGAGLIVTNCVLRRFAQSNRNPATGNGILIAPNSGSVNAMISNVIASENGFAGLFYYPPAGAPSFSAHFDRVVAYDNAYGIAIDTVKVSGDVRATVSNAIVSANLSDGLFVSNGGKGAAAVTIDSTYTDNNLGAGLDVQNSAVVLLSRSVVTSNKIGVVANGSTTSLGDNRISGNRIDIGGVGKLGVASDKPQ